MDLEDLEVYKLAKEVSGKAWSIYQEMDYQTKRILGSQFIQAADSIGANIAEGFGRYHYLDKNKFNYNARASLSESLYWLDLLLERKIIDKKDSSYLKKKLKNLAIKLNNYITFTKKQIK